MTYQITEKIISKNRSYTPLLAKGTVVHETATPGASDENEQKYFDSGYRAASAHAFVDFDSITQTIPWNEQAWHAGRTANRNYIGIELCHYNDADKFQEIWKKAVWLFAWVYVTILNITVLTKDNLMSHAEVSAKWKETDHQDPIAYFKQFGKTVDDFRVAVQAEINSMIGQTQQPIHPQVKPTDNKILELQRVLNKLKITDSKGNKLTEDGLLGGCTKDATKRIQSILGLEVDGSAGPKTIDAINQILAKPVIKVEASGIVVRYLQYRIGASYDGSFGPATRASVIVFQRKNSLVPDGVVGPATWSKLFN